MLICKKKVLLLMKCHKLQIKIRFVRCSNSIKLLMMGDISVLCGSLTTHLWSSSPAWQNHELLPHIPTVFLRLLQPRLHPHVTTPTTVISRSPLTNHPMWAVHLRRMSCGLVYNVGDETDHRGTLSHTNDHKGTDIEKMDHLKYLTILLVSRSQH